MKRGKFTALRKAENQKENKRREEIVRGKGETEDRKSEREWNFKWNSEREE
jgi:hypothetical protein